jgi:DNA invertase Pin-like site-specific DNA recombinase
LAIRNECERRGWVLVRIEEDILSGKNLARPGLQRALEACRGGEVGGIIVGKLDRLSRSIVDSGSSSLKHAAATGTLSRSTSGLISRRRKGSLSRTY